MKNHKFYYGRNLTLAWYGVMLLPVLSFPSMIYREFQKPSEHQTAIYFDIGIFALYIVFIMYILIDSYLINRANQIALELTENEIVDIAGKRTIAWQQVYNLAFEKEKIRVIFKDDSSAPVMIRMSKIKGDPFVNYNKIYDYMEALEKQWMAQAANA